MILCFNAKNLRYKFYAQNEYNISPDEVDDIFEDKANLEITFTLRGLEDGVYHLKEYGMALWDCSVREAWQHYGRRRRRTSGPGGYPVFKKCLPPVYKKE